MIKRSLNVSMVFFLLLSIFCGVIVISPSPAQAATSYLAAKANGNLTDDTTWQLIDTTSYLDSEAGNTALTTSYVTSSAFTPGAITCDGIAVKVALRATSPTTQTFSVALYNSTDSALVAGTEVTIKVSNVPTCVSATTNEAGWVFFKWSSPVLLTAGKAYKVEAKTSAGSMINLFRDGTTGNWSRYLRTTIAQSPVAGDVMHIQREYTGSDTGTSYIITMNQTANMDYGVGTDGVVAMTIGNGCHLTYGTSAATNYYLKLSGNLIVYNGGYLDVGTTGTAIPRDSTAVLEFDPVADGGMGLLVQSGGFLNMQGLSRTSGKNIVSAKLNTDEAIGQTVLGVDTDTGWLNGDEIGIASTTRTYWQCEKRTLSGNANASDITVSASLTYAHSGTSPTQAEVINITRNVKFRSATSTLMTYMYLKATSVTDIDWTEIYYVGHTTAGIYGITVETTTGSFNMQYSSLHDTEDWGFYAYIAGLNNITFSYNVTYNLNSTLSSACTIQIGNTTNTNIILDHNIFMYNLTGWIVVNLYQSGVTFTNNTVIGSNGIGIMLDPLWNGYTNNGTVFDSNVAHSCGGAGINFGRIDNLTSSNCSIWRNSNAGLYNNYTVRDVTLNNWTFAGNANAQMYVLYGSFIRLTLNNCTFDSQAGYTVASGIEFNLTSGMMDCVFNNCTFGTTGTHTNDLNVTYRNLVRLVMNNCTLASATEVAGLDKLDEGSYIKSYNHDLGGTTKNWVRNGEVTKETTVFKTATPSLKQTPSSTTIQQVGEKWLIPCDSGELVTVKIWSRWDSSNTPSTLPQVKLNGCGITESVDTNISTTTVWEQLTVSGVPTSDGCLELVPYSLKSSSATYVYWDDISISYAGGGGKNTEGLKYWFEALPKFMYFSFLYLQGDGGGLAGLIGSAGGSGAGGGIRTAGYTSQGNDGSDAYNYTVLPSSPTKAPLGGAKTKDLAGGGGGGSGSAIPATMLMAGVGGEGYSCNITGSAVKYGGGGGGGARNTKFSPGAGGVGGGGAGGEDGADGTAGIANTGGGGGGGGYHNESLPPYDENIHEGVGGAGGSGIVIVKYGVTVVSFTDSTTWTVPAGVTSAEVLVIGGGGGGGESIGGGGGGGGHEYKESYLTTPGEEITVTVGAGGAGGSGTPGYPPGTKGGDSVFGSLIVYGGGGGAGYDVNSQ